MRPEYVQPAPDASDAVESLGAFRVIDLRRLVEMKVQACRFIDRAHIQDMLAVGLIDELLRASLPDDLRERLGDIEGSSGQGED